jgi:MerR family mercuric resistance operon transcriptional regulator
MRAPLKRGALARLLDCNIETVRYYENIGIISPVERSAAGHRMYSQADMERLRFALRLRELGFSLEEVRSLLALVDSGDYTCAQIADIAEDHLASIRRKIEDLRRLERSLSDVTRQCHRGDTPDCAIIEALGPS